ncbi:ARMT1-like domain-containing protein [Desulfovermiculus halophilus]|uniref:ARMT1-like domain-containing protein n=1 Tax=Desulfovermiculus halophilus TaxID=339722 RepID=UPI0006872E25|nr:ARMT1-like domain-containing protein [Desulfovermiculus halophilus]
MNNLPEVKSIADLAYGRDPYLDAWLLHFMTKNNLEHLIAPDKNASLDQLRFLVDMQEGQFFAPCTDWMLDNLLKSEMTAELRNEYRATWRRLVLLIRHIPLDPYLRRKIVALCRYKFQNTLRYPFVIPSRLMKWLLTIFLSQSALQDPYQERKKTFNARAHKFMHTALFKRFISACPSSTMGCKRIQDLRWQLDILEFKRLFCLSTWNAIWEIEDFSPQPDEVDREIGRDWTDFEQTMTDIFGTQNRGMKILYVPNSAGGILFDLMIVQAFHRLGHKVILALKEGFYYDYPIFWDYENDPVLSEFLNGARLIEDSNISKNDLLDTLRANDLVVISDGTRERLNMYRTSVTFARAWKESDVVIAKGSGNYHRLVYSSHQFTRDILAFYRDEDGTVHFSYKPKSPKVDIHSEKDLVLKAERIKRRMLKAHDNGQKVMFYSAIVGSIPGQTQTAITVLNTFVHYLRTKLEKTYIINPAEHFESGMDADDLMYMWEIVQRSGLLDIWRFQTVEDIETSFELMGEKIPPIWAGKDATYSTGCTKEMQIALEVQQKYPEMQIIGPNPERFFRRREYGIGKFFDASMERRFVRRS